MELPSELLAIVKEYSMPISRSDWRRCGKIRKQVLIRDFHKLTSQREFALFNDAIGRIGYNQNKNKVFDFERYYLLFKRK